VPTAGRTDSAHPARTPTDTGWRGSAVPTTAKHRTTCGGSGRRWSPATGSIHRRQRHSTRPDWAVAVVAARWSPDNVKATLPVIGSVVLITDPDWAEDDAGPDQLYVVSDDFGAPYYQLVRLGGHGPLVPGHALTEVDPARIRLEPAPDTTVPYPPRAIATDG
jgi:hypothetical protein